MMGTGALAFSITIASLFSASFVHAPDPLPNKRQEAGTSSWKEPIKEILNLTACGLVCLLPEYPRICVAHGTKYRTWSKMEFACFEDVCPYLITDAKVIYEDGPCDSEGGKLARAKHMAEIRNRPAPEPRESPVYTDHRSGKQ